MNSDNQNFLVIRAIENAHAPALGKLLHRAPHKIVAQFLGARGTKIMDFDALRINACQHMLDRAIFAGGVHRLKKHEYGMNVLREQLRLQFRKFFNIVRKLRFRALFRSKAWRLRRIGCVERIIVAEFNKKVIEIYHGRLNYNLCLHVPDSSLAWEAQAILPMFVPKLLTTLKGYDRQLFFSEIHSQPYLALEGSGFLKTLGAENLAPTIEEAIARSTL
jgi:hypothetical protein